jgi:hypothetical protein
MNRRKRVSANDALIDANSSESRIASIFRVKMEAEES